MFSSRTNWPLEPNRLAQALFEQRRRGVSIIDLTISNPTACGLVYPEQEILRALSDPRALEYAPESKGRLDARGAVAEYYRGRRGFGDAADGRDIHLKRIVDPERIVFTAGTSEAYTYIFRLLCEPGDEVLVPTPSYPLFGFLADLADVRLVPYPLIYDHGWQMDFDGLRAAAGPRARAAIVVHPNNPSGSFVKSHEAAELAAICKEHEMAIVADEVFLDYSSEAARPASFAFACDVLTFTLSGLSKISALPQMKLAWMIVSGPEALTRVAVERLDVIADSYLSPGTPVQLALPTFLGLRHDLQAQLQARVAANLNCLDAALRAPCSLTRLEREGGWYAILRVPVSGADEMLAVELLERASILVHPGSFYDFQADGFLVLSLITPPADFAEGVSRLRDFFSK
jgi:alanine-synthesizing transaminase